MLSAKPSMPTEWARAMSFAQSAWVNGKVLPTIMCATTSLSPAEADGEADGAAVVDDAEDDGAADWEAEVTTEVELGAAGWEEDAGAVDETDVGIDAEEAMLDDEAEAADVEMEEATVEESDEPRGIVRVRPCGRSRTMP
jgi:hypothetical protein